MTQIPICVIGGGSIGFRHMSVAALSPEVALTAVVEPFEARRNELHALGFPVVASVDDVPAHTRGAVIATPTPDHAGAAHAALSKGWAALVEKPVTATLAEGTALCAAAEAAGLPLYTGHHRRCHPFSSRARALLSEIGDLVGVQGLWSLRKHDTYYDVPWRRAPGAGPILTNLSHEIDLLRFLAGEITEVSAMASSAARGFVIEDTASINFRFENAALGSFLISDAGASPWSFEAATNENPDLAFSGQDSVRLIGTKGALCFPSLTLWHGSGDGETDWRSPLVRTDGPTLETVDPLLVQLERFAKIIDGAEDDLLATGRDGVKTLELTLATLLSAKTGRIVQGGDVPIDFNGVTPSDERM